MANLVLASSSPRRKQLLQQVEIPFIVRTKDVDESIVKTNDPKKKVEKLARLKGEAIPFLRDSEVILSADTVVSYKNQIFHKPKTIDEARKMMRSLSNEKHKVYTGVMIRSQNKEVVFVECTEVQFWPLSDEEIEKYIKTAEPYDKAGGYGIQSIGAKFVKRIEGDYFNIVGLPLSKVVRALKSFNIS